MYIFSSVFLKKTFSSILVHTTFFYYPNQLTMHTFYRVYLFHSRIISWRWSSQRDFSFSLLSATFFFGILLFALFVLLLIGSSLSASSSSLLFHSYSFWITVGWVATLPLLTYILFHADFFLFCVFIHNHMLITFLNFGMFFLWPIFVLSLLLLIERHLHCVVKFEAINWRKKLTKTNSTKTNLTKKNINRKKLMTQHWYWKKFYIDWMTKSSKEEKKKTVCNPQQMMSISFGHNNA